MAIVKQVKTKDDIKLCECGCGQNVNYDKYKPRKYIRGHWLKKDGNPNWTGGIYRTQNYIMISKHDHPNVDSRGYIMQHRLIYEHYLKILFDEDVYIPRNWHIHHENEQVDDNRLINLTCLSHKDHLTIHIQKDMSNRQCELCGSKKTSIRNNGRPIWFATESGFKCNNCYYRLKRK